MISILFHTPSHYPLNRQVIIDAVHKVLHSTFKRDVEVSVSIVGDRLMKTLNTSYRNKPNTTDVLSFPTSDPTQPEKVRFIEAPDDVLRLGDIVVSYPQAVSEAASENMMVDDKIIELVLHGLNHLLGIHHPE